MHVVCNIDGAPIEIYARSLSMGAHACEDYAFMKLDVPRQLSLASEAVDVLSCKTTIV